MGRVFLGVGGEREGWFGSGVLGVGFWEWGFGSRDGGVDG